MPRDPKIDQIIFAIYAGNSAAALRLIEPGLPFDATDQDNHDTPLLAAIRQRNAMVFSALLVAGASATAALAAAMIAFCPDMVDQASADVRLQSRATQTQMLARDLRQNGDFFFWWD